ncbi:negative elongation factor A [Cimex lectularius]|uniref:HDAg domain-containing protein n=1 Tax=Cimex lectularius TaxID=79782 RepID=A0A8I6RF70_CIMLE|nr:negative elongation factor A [Cimex lectularius]
MATVRDSDISLWLHNKLGTSNDSWTSGSICSQLNNEVLRNIKDCFPDLQTQVKLKLLLSFFHIPRRNVEEWKVELEEIVEVAQVDSEQWVSMLAEMMSTLPSTGSLNTVIAENDQNKRIFSDLVNDLRKLVRKHNEVNLLPLECHYLNKSALNNLVGQLPQPTKHFTLKRKPKSAALRAELMQKSHDAASNLKKSQAPTVPVRSRGMPRKMTDTTPLKGIPSRVPSGGFQSGLSNNSLMSRPSLPRNPLPRKDGGIKLLDINEQPLAHAQAKKRKRLQEQEELQAKKTQAEPTTPTPDYALGLVPPPSVAPPTPIPESPAPSYAPSTASSGVSTLLQASAISNNTIISSPPTPIVPIVNKTDVQPAEPVVERPMPPTIRTQTLTISEDKKYELTRDQVSKAQKLFCTANKVTRPEKSLILGFIAGSRDNPCPQLGDVITIKLSEYQEMVKQDSKEVPKIVETHFQMNYINGEWNLINRYRDIDPL